MFFFALVDAGSDTFLEAYERNDADVFSFTMTHSEGEFPTLTIEVKNPREGLLSAARKRWAWLAWDNGSETVPLFYGRLVGAPEGLDEETVRLVLIARPEDYAAQKEAVADGLRVLPYYDPVWISAEQRADPDVTLQARAALWHVDRITHVVTASDFIEGEVGPVAITHYRDNLDFRYTKSPGRQVRVNAEVSWEQRTVGSINITDNLTAAFADAGSQYQGFLSSYTGEGLIRSWPETGTFIGGGWSVGPVTLERVDGTQLPREFGEVTATTGGQGAFPLWQILCDMSVNYNITRSMAEGVTFTVDADIQPLIVGADEPDIIEINLSTSAAGEFINGVLPIGDTRRRSYFQTDRGQQSLAHLIALARSRLLAQARAAEVIADITFADAVALSCRHSATVTDPRLPGGAAFGKVSEYSFGFSGDEGELKGSVTLACTVGRGVSLIPDDAVNGYAEDGYVVSGYQALTSGGAFLDTGDLAYEYFGGVAINDDGVDLFNLTAEDMVISCTVANGQTAQAAILTEPYEDLSAAAQAMNTVPTRVTLDMLPIDGLSFRTDYTITTTALSVPKTIDLEAAA